MAASRGTTSLSIFEVEDAALCGAQVVEGAALDLSFGEVRGCAIGACVQVDGYDLGRVNRDVSYRDNGQIGRIPCLRALTT